MELLTLPEHQSSPPVHSGFPVTRSLVLCVCLVYLCLSFFFCPLCCLSFDFTVLITHLVSSNSSKLLNFFFFIEFTFCIEDNIVLVI